MPAATTIITAATTKAGTFSIGQAKATIVSATSASGVAGWSASQEYRCICPPSPRRARCLKKSLQKNRNMILQSSPAIFSILDNHVKNGDDNAGYKPAAVLCI
jgi:hypothetical protein